MAEGYVPYDLAQNETDVQEEIYEYIRNYFPQWEPRAGHLEVIMSEAFSLIVTEIRALVNNVPPTIFRYFGRLVGIPPEEATSATTVSTWAVRADGGPYTIPEGTLVAFDQSGETVIFETINEVTVPAGSASTAPGEVVLQAYETGERANGFSGRPRLIDLLDFVVDVASIGTTEGGRDEEDPEVYENRLSNRLQLLADRPILPRDVERYVQTVPRVDRALAIDGYNPADGTFDNERMVAVAPLQVGGVQADTALEAAVAARLESSREANFIFHVIRPTYNPIEVTASVKAHPDYDKNDLQARVKNEIAAYLNPGEWGGGSIGEERVWIKQIRVRFLELVQVLANVEGVDYVVDDSLRINGLPQNFDMAGAAPLPAPNPTVNITAI